MPVNKTSVKGITIHWIGHSTVGIYGEKTVYFDPFMEVLQGDEKTADLIVSSHGHRDHFDVAAINKLSDQDTTVILTPGCSVGDLVSKKFKVVANGESITIDDIEIKTVPAYNVKRFRSPGIPFHPEGFGMGVVLTMEGIKLYYAGDTDFIDPMKELAQAHIDVAFLPIGGTYTMDIDEAVEAVKAIQPGVVIPVHFNHIKSTEADPQDFKQKINQVSQAEVIILQ